MSSWADAVGRATTLADNDRPGGMDENCWDDVAMRDIVALALYCLHVRDGRPVTDVPWVRVLWWLGDDVHLTELVETALPAAGHQLRHPGKEIPREDPVVACWQWLNRTWDPDAPARPAGPATEARWGGMSRGIAPGLPDPALEVCQLWSAGLVERAVAAGSGAYARGTRVRVTAGPLKANCGTVRGFGWHIDDAAERVSGPIAYVLALDTATEDVELPVGDVTADRSEPTGPPPDLFSPGPPQAPPSCAEDLEAALARAVNPEVVPEDLRQTIRSARRDHHLTITHQATPHPHRLTWRILLHWYALGDNPADADERAELWEIITTRHLHDHTAVHYLALSEEQAHTFLRDCVSQQG